MIKALFAFVSGVLRRLYWILPSFLVDPFDIAAKFGVSYEPPQWLFWVLLLLGFSWATFLTYYDVKQKLDETKEELFLEPINFGGDTLNSMIMTICLRATPKVIVDTLYLLADNQTLFPEDWHPITVNIQRIEGWRFDYKNKLLPCRDYQGVLVAKVNNKEYRSRDFQFRS